MAPRPGRSLWAPVPCVRLPPMSDSDRGRRMPHLNRDGIDGEDPMAEVGPEACAPDALDVEHKVGERSGAPHESEFESRDEIDEAFPVESLATPMAADGLPDHSADPVGEGAPPFTYETVCCIADDRAYVEVFDGEVAAAEGADPLPRQVGWARRVHPATGVVTHVRHPGSNPVPLSVLAAFDKHTGKARTRDQFTPDEVEERWGIQVVNGARGYRPVRPIREACRFYKRQHFATEEQPIPGEPGHNVFYLNCTAPGRRSIGGAAMSLRDEAIYGCDHREPHDAACLQFIDAYYSHTLRTQPHRTRLPMFGGAGDIVVQEPHELWETK